MPSAARSQLRTEMKQITGMPRQRLIWLLNTPSLSTTSKRQRAAALS